MPFTETKSMFLHKHNSPATKNSVCKTDGNSLATQLINSQCVKRPSNAIKIFKLSTFTAK